MNILNKSGKSQQLWIAKVEVRPSNNSTILEGAKGAFVNLVTWASDIKEYRRRAGIVLGELELSIVDIEDAEPVSVRRTKSSFDEEIEEIITRAEDNPNAIIYGTFHTWDRDTA